MEKLRFLFSAILLHVSGLLFYLRAVDGTGYIEVTNLPSSVDLYEDDPAGTFVYTVVYFKTPGVTSAVTCDTSDTANFNSTSRPAGTTAADITLKTTKSISFASSPIYLTITCTESGTGVSGTATLTINLIENTPPYFDNGNDFGSATVSSKTTKAGDVVLKLAYSDDEDTVPLTTQTIISVVPASTFFNVSGDFITVTEDLITKTSVANYNITITVNDGRNDLTGTATIYVIERNTPPKFVPTLGAYSDTIDFPEFTEGRLLVYDLDFLDAEGDAITIMDIGGDSNVTTYFDLVPSTGEIYLIGGKMLDYEAVDKFTFVVTIKDYLETNPTSTFTLTIIVNPINERPTFNATPSAIYVNEANISTVIGTPDALCTDPDNTSPQYTILLGDQSSYFRIDNETGQLSFDKEFDYDDVNLPNEVNLTIRCFDDYGLSDDTFVTIIVQDINDNNPRCKQSDTSFNLKYNQPVNETIINVDCSDKDSNENAELDYEIVGFSSGYSKSYFQVDAYGNVSIFKLFQMDYNTSFYVTVVVSDRGTPSLSYTFTLSITYTEEPLIIVYEEVKECFLCTTSALTLLAVAGLALFMLVTCGVVLTVLRCCYGWERIKIERTLTKKKKRSWRWCGCLRPGERKKPKKAKKEIVLAENRDHEYMRARNALLGIEEPQSEGPPVASADIPLSKARRHGKKTQSASTSAAQNVAYMGRDKTPDISATPVDKMGLTPSQKIQLQKFEEMKRSTAAADGPSTSKNGQAAGKMVWAFGGR